MTMRPTLSPETAADPRWRSIAARDRAADGTFFFGVRTTGIYCRPSCAAKRPKPENVTFYASAASAERAGFRPCRRCRPDRPETWAQNTQIVAEICRMIDASDEIPDLGTLARKAGFSPHHFHRLFRETAGVTPRQYAQARRAARVRDDLAKGTGVTEAIHNNGYSSAGRFYENADTMLGMKPGDFRTGGTGTEIRYAIGESSLGRILVATTTRGICAIFLDDDPDEMVRELRRRFPRADIAPAGAEFDRTVARVVAFAERPQGALDLPLDLKGTAFQRRVWNALRQIPAGQTATYGQIAERIGAPGAVRAVGAACGANHVSLAVPCHRVVGSGGKLTGYRWGVERKRKLLQREQE